MEEERSGGGGTGAGSRGATPPAVADVALRVDGLSVPFGAAAGLANITFQVASGERLVLLGSSGAGKTTLLRGIAGLVPTGGGTVHVAGRDVTREPPERRGVVYLHQTPVLFPHLDVFENVAFPLRLRGVGAEELRRRVEESLEIVQLGPLARRGPGALSGGQKHRVALARAVVSRPALLLLDEPLSSLDPALRHDLRGAITTLQEEYGPGLVMVTHDLEDAGLLGHRVGVLMEGGLAQVDTPLRLFGRPASLPVARFLGFRNLVEGMLGEDGVFRSALGEIRLGGGEGIPPGEGSLERGAGMPGAEAPAGARVAVLPPGAVRVVSPGLRGVQGSASTGAARGAVHFPGRVHGVVHPGARALLTVEVGGVRLEVDPGEGPPPDQGADVVLELDPHRLLLFPP
jgi:putative spermidine/putrescine transport system ATP-binding protein